MRPATSRSLRRRHVVAGMAASSLAPLRSVHSQSSSDTLRIIHVGRILDLNPFRASIDIGYIVRALFPPLTRFAKAENDPRLGWQALIAEPSAVWRDDNKQLHIDIRLPNPARRWSSGRTNTAEEVVRGLKVAKDRAPPRLQYGLSEIANFTIIDPSTCRVTVTQRDTRLFKGTFTQPWATPMSQELADRLAEKEPMFKPFDGLGPYVLKDYRIGERLDLMANAVWNAKKMPTIAAIRVYEISDPATALAFFQGGDADIVRLPSGDVLMNQSDVARRFGPGIAVAAPVVDSVVYIGMDVKDPDSQDIDRRVAARAAVDPTLVAREARGEGGAEPTSEFLPASFERRERRAATAFYNPSEARERLSRVRGRAPRAIRLNVPPLSPDLERALASVERQLSAVGFEVRRVPWRGVGPREPGDGLSLFLSRTSVVRDPPMAFESFVSNSPTNVTGASIPALDKAFLDAIARFDERDSLLTGMQRMLDADPVAIPLYQERERYLYRSSRVRPTFGSDGRLGDLIDFTFA